MVYAAVMTFRPDDLDLLATTEEVEIETRAADGAVHRTIIWVVVDGSDVFIRSVRGATARWYREARAARDVAIHVAGRRVPVRVVPAPDPDSIARASAQLGHKYTADPATPAMLRDEVLGTTLRLDPA